MDDLNELTSTLERSVSHLEYDMQVKKIKEELIKKFTDYQKTILYLSADAPITILNLPKSIENSLMIHGCLRVYDIIDLDFTKVKGLGTVRIRELTTRLNEFLSML